MKPKFKRGQDVIFDSDKVDWIVALDSEKEFCNIYDVMYKPMDDGSVKINYIITVDESVGVIEEQFLKKIPKIKNKYFMYAVGMNFKAHKSIEDSYSCEVDLDKFSYIIEVWRSPISWECTIELNFKAPFYGRLGYSTNLLSGILFKSKYEAIDHCILELSKTYNISILTETANQL